MISDSGVVLILDEAQRIADFVGTPYKMEVGGLLEEIHNGKLRKPAILLAAGLGTTIASFGKLGISRFSRNCVAELSALSYESERLVIRDWLTKEGGCKGDPSAWIDVIAQETHGWPQHIQCYAYLASEYLRKNHGVMTPAGLDSILEAGHEDRKVYYKQRVEEFRIDQIRCLAKTIMDVAQGEPVEYKVMMSSLIQEYGQSGAEDLFKKFEQKGILGQNDMGYMVSIPSMHAWLKDTYARSTIEMPREPQKIRLEGDSGSGFES